MNDNRPTLKNREAFEKILTRYQVSDQAKQVLARSPFVVLSGIAGGGRNTVIRYLMGHFDYAFVISDTTRPPKFRDGRMEEDGVDYYFRDEDELLGELENGEFVEAELIHDQQVSGTSIREVKRIQATGKIPIHDYEFGGANAVAAAKPDAAIIGLLPPSYDEWIRRLSSRETMDEQEFTNRLITARNVLENMLSKPYFKYVINETVEQCAASIRRIVEQNADAEEAERAKIVAGDILARVTSVLAERQA